MTIRELKNFQNQIKNIIIKTTNKCNQFYSAFNISQRDMVSFAENGDINAMFEGAKEFERIFLLGGKSLNKSGQRDTVGLVNEIMATQHYQDMVRDRLRIESEAISFENSGIYEELISMEEKSVSKRSKNVQDAWNKAMKKASEEEIIETLFFIDEQHQKKGKTLALDTQKFLKNFFGKREDLSKLLGYDDSIFTNKKKLNKVKNSLISYYKGTVFKKEKVIDIMWKVLLEEVRKKGTDILANFLEQSKELEFIFKDSVNTSFSSLFQVGEREDIITFKENDIKLNGAIFEQSINFSIQFGIKFYQKDLNIKSSEVVGQQLREDEKKGKQTGSDLIVIDNNNNKYLIQAKNSFSENKWGSIHLQSEISVDTFAKDVFGDGSRMFELFEYVLFNRAFLEKYGMSYGFHEGTAGPSFKNANWNSSDDPDFLKIINYFINQTMLYLISGKVLSMEDNGQIEEAESMFNKGNLFFIYRQRYLIPISILLFSSYIIITKILTAIRGNSPNSIRDYNIGELSYAKGLIIKNIEIDGEKFNKAKAKEIYEEKINAGRAADGKTRTFLNDENIVGWNYPDTVVEIGNKVFTEYQQKAKLKGINFNRLNIEKLNKYLDLL